MFCLILLLFINYIALLDGKGDEFPEKAFYMTGSGNSSPLPSSKANLLINEQITASSWTHYLKSYYQKPMFVIKSEYYSLHLWSCSSWEILLQCHYSVVGELSRSSLTPSQISTWTICRALIRCKIRSVGDKWDDCEALYLQYSMIHYESYDTQHYGISESRS